MGMSAPPPASIDLVGSYARRRGGDVELVLWAPTEATDAVAVELRRQSMVVRGTVQFVQDARGERLVAVAPRAQLSDGQWTISAVTPDDQHVQVQARLLVQGERPLVLLWGGTLPRPGIESTIGAAPARERAAQVGGQLVTSALRPLPTPVAVSVRTSWKRVVRRLVG